MGMYDILAVGDEEFQIKCLKNPYMRTFHVGDNLSELHSTSIKFPEVERYANISPSGVFMGFSTEPLFPENIISKWGLPQDKWDDPHDDEGYIVRMLRDLIAEISPVKDVGQTPEDEGATDVEPGSSD